MDAVKEKVVWLWERLYVRGTFAVAVSLTLFSLGVFFAFEGSAPDVDVNMRPICRNITEICVKATPEPLCGQAMEDDGLTASTALASAPRIQDMIMDWKQQAHKFRYEAEEEKCAITKDAELLIRQMDQVKVSEIMNEYSVECAAATKAGVEAFDGELSSQLLEFKGRIKTMMEVALPIAKVQYENWTLAMRYAACNFVKSATDNAGHALNEMTWNFQCTSNDPEMRTWCPTVVHDKCPTPAPTPAPTPNITWSPQCPDTAAVDRVLARVGPQHSGSAATDYTSYVRRGKLLEVTNGDTSAFYSCAEHFNDKKNYNNQTSQTAINRLVPLGCGYSGVFRVTCKCTLNSWAGRYYTQSSLALEGMSLRALRAMKPAVQAWIASLVNVATYEVEIYETGNVDPEDLLDTGGNSLRYPTAAPTAMVYDEGHPGVNYSTLPWNNSTGDTSTTSTSSTSTSSTSTTSTTATTTTTTTTKYCSVEGSCGSVYLKFKIGLADPEDGGFVGRSEEQRTEANTEAVNEVVQRLRTVGRSMEDASQWVDGAVINMQTFRDAMNAQGWGQVATLVGFTLTEEGRTVGRRMADARKITMGEVSTVTGAGTRTGGAGLRPATCDYETDVSSCVRPTYTQAVQCYLPLHRPPPLPLSTDQLAPKFPEVTHLTGEEVVNGSHVILGWNFTLDLWKPPVETCYPSLDTSGCANPDTLGGVTIPSRWDKALSEDAWNANRVYFPVLATKQAELTLPVLEGVCLDFSPAPAPAAEIYNSSCWDYCEPPGDGIPDDDDPVTPGIQDHPYDDIPSNTLMMRRLHKAICCFEDCIAERGFPLGAQALCPTLTSMLPTYARPQTHHQIDTYEFPPIYAELTPAALSQIISTTQITAFQQFGAIPGVWKRRLADQYLQSVGPQPSILGGPGSTSWVTPRTYNVTRMNDFIPLLCTPADTGGDNGGASVAIIADNTAAYRNCTHCCEARVNAMKKAQKWNTESLVVKQALLVNASKEKVKVMKKGRDKLKAFSKQNNAFRKERHDVKLCSTTLASAIDPICQQHGCNPHECYRVTHSCPTPFLEPMGATWENGHGQSGGYRWTAQTISECVDSDPGASTSAIQKVQCEPCTVRLECQLGADPGNCLTTAALTGNYLAATVMPALPARSLNNFPRVIANCKQEYKEVSCVSDHHNPHNHNTLGDTKKIWGGQFPTSKSSLQAVGVFWILLAPFFLFKFVPKTQGAGGKQSSNAVGNRVAPGSPGANNHMDRPFSGWDPAPQPSIPGSLP
jgi:hypothetical protein